MHTRTMVRGLVTTAGLALMIPLASTPAQASTTDLSFNVDASTTIKNVKQTVSIPTGTLTATADTSTGTLSDGTLSLPDATQRLSYSTIPLADVTVAFHQAAPVTGSFDLNAGTADAQASFDVQVVAVRPVQIPWLNLISGSCTTEAPSTVQIAGAINAGGASTFESEYRLANFDDCGGRFVDRAVSAGLSGRGNTMSVTLS